MIFKVFPCVETRDSVGRASSAEMFVIIPGYDRLTPIRPSRFPPSPKLIK